MPRPVFLIGGGRDPDGIVASHRPFVEAVDGCAIACFAVDDGGGIDEARWIDGLRSAGARDVTLVTDPGELHGAAGVYVCGGLTPLYRERLEGTTLPEGVPYAGFSAGAAVAASKAIVGGWRIGALQVCAEEAGEDLNQVEPLPGLGLVPYSVDVHATQWGTLSRLVHAVAAGLVDEGWAIDEHTCLTGDGEVHGLGAAYYVSRDLRVDVRRGTASSP